jgi:hypothetical protein
VVTFSFSAPLSVLEVVVVVVVVVVTGGGVEDWARSPELNAQTMAIRTGLFRTIFLVVRYMNF